MDPLFRLHRLYPASALGQFGVLRHGFSPFIPFAVTLEKTYPGPLGPPGYVTKIPLGDYRCIPTTFFHGGYATFEILVPGRTRLLFHKGNLEKDSDGCILIAESFGVLEGRPGITDSAGGFSEFMSFASQHSEFTIRIT